MPQTRRERVRPYLLNPCSRSRDKSPKKLAAKAPPTVCRGHRLDGVLTSPGKSATIAGFEIPLAIAR
jgi:hypothetical protein